jgi:Domain of unknown function (DUF4129)
MKRSFPSVPSVVRVLVLTCCLLASAARAATTPGEYSTTLTASTAAARASRAANEAQATALLREARAQLPRAAVVQGAAGPPVTVANRELIRALDRAIAAKTVAGRRQATAEFVRRAEVLASAVATTVPRRSPAEMKALQEVLARSEFQVSPLERWETEARAWLMERLRRLFGNVSPRALDTIARVLYWVFHGVLILLLAYLIWTYVPGLRLRRRGKLVPATPEDEIGTPDSAGGHLAAAEAAAAAGRFLDALRHTYTAMLLLLDAANVVPYDRARTNREVLRALRGATHAPVREVLRPVTDTLDETLYGGRAASAEEYRWCRGEYNRLEVLLAP